MSTAFYPIAIDLLNKVKAWRDCDGNDGFPHEVREQIDALLGAVELRASQRTEQQPDPWRQAVDEALIAHALDCTGPSDDPKEKVKELLEWAVTIATDPRVSDGMEQDQPPRYWVHRERSYSQRAKAIIAFNTCSGDLDDKLNAAWGAALAADKKGEV